jgi:hypothetical protein
MKAMKNRAVERLERAAAVNRERDASDREAGLAAPPDCPPDEVMRTAIAGLETALTMEDWDIVAEVADILASATNYYPWKRKKYVEK